MNEDYKELKKQFNALKKQVTVLKNKNAKLNNENKTLKIEVKNLKGAIMYGHSEWMAKIIKNLGNLMDRMIAVEVKCGLSTPHPDLMEIILK